MTTMVWPVSGDALRVAALRRFLVEMSQARAAEKRREAASDAEPALARQVAKWFDFQGKVLVEVLGRTMGDRLDRDAALRAREQAPAVAGLSEDTSWSDWEYLINSVLYGNHDGGQAALRDLLDEAGQAAYLTGAAAFATLLLALAKEADGAVAATITAALSGKPVLPSVTIKVKPGVRFSVGSEDAVAWARANAARKVTRINETTRQALRRIITQAVAEGWSWERTGKVIAERYSEFAGPPLFPSKKFRSRAQAIAGFEIGDAYEAGSWSQMERLERTLGVQFEKYWRHSHDDKVRPEHRENERAGWIAKDAAFPDGTLRPPTDPGCRCTLLWRPVGSNW